MGSQKERPKHEVEIPAEAKKVWKMRDRSVMGFNQTNSLKRKK